MKKHLFFLSTVVLFTACNNNNTNNESSGLQDSVQAYIDQYAAAFQELSTKANEAQWQSNIRIIEGDSTNTIATNKTQQQIADFTGSEENSAYQANDEQILILYKNNTLLDIANASDNLNISVLSKPIVKHFLCVEREIWSNF